MGASDKVLREIYMTNKRWLIVTLALVAASCSSPAQEAVATQPPAVTQPVVVQPLVAITTTVPTTTTREPTTTAGSFTATIVKGIWIDDGYAYLAAAPDSVTDNLGVSVCNLAKVSPSFSVFYDATFRMTDGQLTQDETIEVVSAVLGAYCFEHTYNWEDFDHG